MNKSPSFELPANISRGTDPAGITGSTLPSLSSALVACGMEAA